jgi:hypothetical protein
VFWRERRCSWLACASLSGARPRLRTDPDPDPGHARRTVTAAGRSPYTERRRSRPFRFVSFVCLSAVSITLITLITRITLIRCHVRRSHRPPSHPTPRPRRGQIDTVADARGSRAPAGAAGSVPSHRVARTQTRQARGESESARGRTQNTDKARVRPASASGSGSASASASASEFDSSLNGSTDANA